MRRHDYQTALFVKYALLIPLLSGCGDDDSHNANGNNTNANQAVCGDGAATGAETCDGSDLRHHRCATIGQGFGAGTLGCGNDCESWDVSACVVTSTCGNDTLDPGEVCDGTHLRGHECTSIGQRFVGGTLGCEGDCLAWDTTACVPPQCGNGEIELDETCDGSDVGGHDCTTLGLGFFAGTLACQPNCQGLDLSGCRTPQCGNDVIEGVEPCDGTRLDDHDCLSLGYAGGELACRVDCLAFDTSSCLGHVCGDGIVQSPEPCDGQALGAATCSSLGYESGEVACSAACDAVLAGNCSDLWSTCGDGIIEGTEQCEGPNTQGYVCQHFGFSGGTLGCSSQCRFDVSGCTGDVCTNAGWYGDGWCEPCHLLGGSPDPQCAAVCTVPDGVCSSWVYWAHAASSCMLTVGTEDPDCGTCGDGVAVGQIGEQCDATDLGGVTGCADLGYAGGDLGCHPNCSFDVSSCAPFPCGNDVREGNEQCDGDDLGEAECAVLGLGFTGGTLTCDPDCHFDVSGCN